MVGVAREGVGREAARAAVTAVPMVGQRALARVAARVVALGAVDMAVETAVVQGVTMDGEMPAAVETDEVRAARRE